MCAAFAPDLVERRSSGRRRTSVLAARLGVEFAGTLRVPQVRRGGRVAEGARLESVFTGNRNVGSNPTPSAKTPSWFGEVPLSGPSPRCLGLDAQHRTKFPAGRLARLDTLGNENPRQGLSGRGDGIGVGVGSDPVRDRHRCVLLAGVRNIARAAMRARARSEKSPTFLSCMGLPSADANRCSLHLTRSLRLFRPRRPSRRPEADRARSRRDRGWHG